MKILGKISIMASAAVMMLAGCSKWTEPQSLDYRRQSPEQENPEQYAAYLEQIKAFKKTEHHVMFVGMEGIAEHPSSQSQHLMAMPDSADYIVMRMGNALHPVVAGEIATVLERKGTKTLLYVDYALIAEAWSNLEDERADKGQEPGTEEELKAFYRKQAEAQIARCNEYGFAGIMVSYLGTKVGTGSIAQEAFMEAVKAFHSANPGKDMVFRGGARNIIDQEFLKEFRYLVIVAGEERKLSLLPGRVLGSSAPTDRVIMELTVPSSDVPEQLGMSPVEAAQWLWTEVGNKDFTPRGLCVENAHDDYFCKDMAFKNVRAAITVLNTEPTVE